MLRKLIAPALAATLVLAACESTTAPVTTTDDDYSLVMFGEAGASLEGTMGAQPTAAPFDGRSGTMPFPDSIALTQAQKDAIQALRTAFRAANQPALDSLKTIFERARAARAAGANREAIHAILVTGRPIGEALRPKVFALHLAVVAVLTPSQRAWLLASRLGRPAAPSPMVGRP